MNMYYYEIATDNDYKNYIQKFWCLNNSQNPFPTEPRYGLPNGCCTIAFISGNGMVLNFGEDTVTLPGGIYLTGQITKRVGITLQPHSKAVMAQVKPWFPLLITKHPMHELTNVTCSLAHLNASLYNRLANIDFTKEAILIPELYRCLDFYPDANADSRFVQWAFSRLEKGFIAGEQSIADMSIASGYTQRRIEQKFKALVGPTAKEMQRIMQLRKLIDDMQKNEHNGNLTILAHRYGYYDQSHFIKSYQRIIADLPSQFNSDNYILPINGHFDFLQS